LQQKIFTFFERDEGLTICGDEWCEVQVIDASVEICGECSFGSTLALSGDFIFVDEAVSEIVVVFKRNVDGDFVFHQTLIARDSGLSFGQSIDMSSEWAAVGARNYVTNRGAVWVYRLDTAADE